VHAVNTFSGASLDRAGARRTDDAWVEGMLADPRSRGVPVVRDGVLLGADGRLARVPLAPGDVDPLLLGLEEDGSALFALDMDGAEPPPGTRPVGLREAAALLPQGDGGLVAQATGLVNWHRRHPRCSVCGEATQIAEAGYVRHCPHCGATHHPRTDPVVIMLVTDGDRALLGRQARWPPGRYSALAGFVEPGETLEEAVAREVREEAGIEIEAPAYASSQPWPFPGSLMLGFAARWRSGEPRRQEREIEDVRWFSRAEVAAAVAGDGALGLPDRYAIARRLIEAWLAN
jgi:NAD+ diphosphatase